jgi:hypothetical protein
MRHAMATISRPTVDWDELHLMIVDDETTMLSSFDEDIPQISEVAVTRGRTGGTCLITR